MGGGFFELNHPTQLKANHPNTRLSADQMIHFAGAVGLEVTLVLYGMLEALLMKARMSGVGLPQTSRFPAGRSPFPSVAVSAIGDSVTSRSTHSLPTSTGIEGSHIFLNENVLQEPCFSKQVDAHLAKGHTRGSGMPGSASLKTLQQNKLN